MDRLRDHLGEYLPQVRHSSELLSSSNDFIGRARLLTVRQAASGSDVSFGCVVVGLLQVTDNGGLSLEDSTGKVICEVIHVYCIHCIYTRNCNF